MRESTGTKAVRVSLLKKVQPLTPELGGVVIKAGLPAVGELGVPVRPVLDISYMAAMLRDGGDLDSADRSMLDAESVHERMFRCEMMMMT